jgi:hypothetical protein
MEEKNWREYLKNEEIKYNRLGRIKCSAFGGEEIYFNHYGLHHLIYKGDKVRTKDEIIKRFSLILFAPNIIKKIKSVDKEEKRTKGKTHAYFWTIKHKVHHNLWIRIIIRRLNNGTLHFFSIMKE